MSFGLELYNEQQQTVLSTPHLTGQIAGVLELFGSTPGASQDGFGRFIPGDIQKFIVPNVPAGSSIWYTLVCYNQYDYRTASGYGQISHEGNTISYTFYNPGQPSAIFYGYK